MGKALSGELSCPCDRSCLFLVPKELKFKCGILSFISDHSYKASSPLLQTSAFHFMSESDSGTSSTTPPSSPIRQKNKKGKRPKNNET